MQRPCRGRHTAGGFARVKVKLTMRLRRARPLARVRLAASPVFSRFREAVRPGGVKQIGHRAGRGGDYRTPRKDRSDQGGCSQHPPFLLLARPAATVHLHRRAKPPISTSLASRRQGRRSLGIFPANPQPDLPPEPPQSCRAARADPDIAGCADRLCAADRAHPSARAAAAGMGGLDHRRRSASSRSATTPTLLDVDFPGGAGAKVWTFVTYSLLHANLSHIGFNVLWLLPFGSALARRFGAVALLSVHGGDGGGRRARPSRHP